MTLFKRLQRLRAEAAAAVPAHQGARGRGSSKLGAAEREREERAVSVRPQRTLARAGRVRGRRAPHRRDGRRDASARRRSDTGVRFVRTDLPGRPEVRGAPGERALRSATPGGARSSSRTASRSTPWSTCWRRSPGSASTTCVIETSTHGDPGARRRQRRADRARCCCEAGHRRPGPADAPHQGDASRCAGRENGVELQRRAVPRLPHHLHDRLRPPADRRARRCRSTSTTETFLRGDRAGAHVRAGARPRGAAPGRAGSRAGGSRARSWSASDRILNPEPLRFPDEFVRHKILDLLGDLFLLGGPLLGHVTALRSGHQGHVAFVQHLKETLPLPGRRAGGAAATSGTSPRSWTSCRTAIRSCSSTASRASRRGDSIEGIKNVTINEPFFQGHFPGHPIMPAVLIIEAMAQVGGLLLLNSVDDPNDKLDVLHGHRRRAVPPPGDARRPAALQAHAAQAQGRDLEDARRGVRRGPAGRRGRAARHGRGQAAAHEHARSTRRRSSTPRAQLGVDVDHRPGRGDRPARHDRRPAPRIGSHALVTGWTTHRRATAACTTARCWAARRRTSSTPASPRTSRSATTP